jgi:RNA polymerase primary sigma factor
MIQELVSRAEKQGYITLNDILELTDEENKEEYPSLESILYELDELGIEIRNVLTDDDDDSAVDSPLSDDDFNSEDPYHQMHDLMQVSSEDPVGLYFRQMSQEPLLSAEEEIELARRIQNGTSAHARLADTLDPNILAVLHAQISDAVEARQHLSRANTRLVVSIAKRYMGQGLPFPDLIQEGNVGLMRAVDKYDHERGNRFSTYATWWIRQAITRALAQKTRTIRIPLHMTERIRQMYRVTQTLEQQLGHRPSVQDIALEMNLPVDVIRAMLDASQHAIALEKPVGEDGDSEFGEFLEDEESPSPVETATHHLLQETIETALQELTPRQSHIIRLRYGLNNGEAHTLEEIADLFGLSRERIRQLEREALNQLRHPRLALTLKDYWT